MADLPNVLNDGKHVPLELHYEEANEVDHPIDPIAEKKLVRKIDLYLMPSIFVLYLFSFVVSQFQPQQRADADSLD